eukprot:s2056_g5.t2
MVHDEKFQVRGQTFSCGWAGPGASLWQACLACLPLLPRSEKEFQHLDGEQVLISPGQYLDYDQSHTYQDVSKIISTYVRERMEQLCDHHIWFYGQDGGAPVGGAKGKGQGPSIGGFFNGKDAGKDFSKDGSKDAGKQGFFSPKGKPDATKGGKAKDGTKDMGKYDGKAKGPPDDGTAATDGSKGAPHPASKDGGKGSPHDGSQGAAAGSTDGGKGAAAGSDGDAKRQEEERKKKEEEEERKKRHAQQEDRKKKQAQEEEEQKKKKAQEVEKHVQFSLQKEVHDPEEWSEDADAENLRMVQEAEEKRESKEKERQRKAAEKQERKHARELWEEEQRKKAEQQLREFQERRRAEDKKAEEEAKEKSRREADEKSRMEAEEKSRREAVEKSRREAEEKSRREAEEKSRMEAEEKSRMEKEWDQELSESAEDTSHREQEKEGAEEKSHSDLEKEDWQWSEEDQRRWQWHAWGRYKYDKAWPDSHNDKPYWKSWETWEEEEEEADKAEFMLLVRLHSRFLNATAAGLLPDGPSSQDVSLPWLLLTKLISGLAQVQDTCEEALVASTIGASQSTGLENPSAAQDRTGEALPKRLFFDCDSSAAGARFRADMLELALSACNRLESQRLTSQHERAEQRQAVQAVAVGDLFFNNGYDTQLSLCSDWKAEGQRDINDWMRGRLDRIDDRLEVMGEEISEIHAQMGQVLQRLSQ